MLRSDPVLGIDFGTSNSAAGLTIEGAAQVLTLEGASDTLPTAVFFDFEEKCALYGRQANQALFDGAWGRYMRALKSLLGTALIREKTMFLGKRQSYIEIVGHFLREVKTRAEAQTGLVFERALSGRPVRFHADAARDAQALSDLRDCYAAAGFAQVSFMNEPEAAARARAHVLSPGDLGLVIDIGGGTSDFTLFRVDPGPEIDIVHSEGLRLGGTDFDRQLSLDHAMPMMGRGSQIRHAFGKDTHLAPNWIFNDLATWQKIPFLYAQDTRKAASDLLKYAVEQDKLARLVRVLEDERGHDLAFAVEEAKIAANAGSAQPLSLEALEKGLSVPLPVAALAESLASFGQEIGHMARKTVEDAGYAPEAVTHLILVGGTSLMQVVQSALGDVFPRAARQQSGALTGIVEGLAGATDTHG